MGFTTVAILHNDLSHEIEKSERLGADIAEAMRGWWSCRHGSGDFRVGSVISREHADAYQIVIVHGNTGEPVRDAKDLHYSALNQMADCLKRHGWMARPPSKRKRAVKAELASAPNPTCGND